MEQDLKSDFKDPMQGLRSTKGVGDRNVFIFSSLSFIIIITKKMNSSAMRYLSIILIISLLLLGPSSAAYSEHSRRNVTPYGDFCPQCTKYGTCKDSMSHDEARKAMFDYYHKKGLAVEIEHKKGGS